MATRTAETELRPPQPRQEGKPLKIDVCPLCGSRVPLSPQAAQADLVGCEAEGCEIGEACESLGPGVADLVAQEVERCEVGEA